MIKYILLLLLLVACQDSKQHKGDVAIKVIPVEKGITTVVDKLLLSKSVKCIDLIALETSEVSVFAGIRNIVIAPQYVFINTMTRVLCFDRNGKYIRDIGQLGQGSIDYNYSCGIGVDSVHQIVYVASGLSSNNELKKYSFDGKYLGSLSIAKRGTQMTSSTDHREDRNYCYVNDKHLFRRLLPVNDGSNDIWQIMYQDTLGKIVDKIYDPACIEYEKRMVREDKGLSEEQFRNIWGTHSPMINFFQNNTNVLFDANDTIYSYSSDEKKLECRYIMDTHRNPQLDFGDMRVLGKSDAYFKEIVAREIYEAKDYLYISVEKDDWSYLIEWNKNGGSVCSIRNKGVVKKGVMGGKIRETLQTGWTNDICGGPQFYQDHHTRNQWIGVYYAEDLLNLDVTALKKEKVLCPNQRDKLVNIIENMTEDSNPVIIVATLKE